MGKVKAITFGEELKVGGSSNNGTTSSLRSKHGSK